ncbi:MAG TPA: DNA internalization-related competence protein ComEC/Rec2 [Anaerolineae bacterium]
MLLVYWTVGWFFGLWLASLAGLNLWNWLALGGAGLVGVVVLRRQANAGLLLVCLAGVGLGAARYQTSVSLIDETHIAFYNDTTGMTITGTVIAEPDVGDRSVDLHLAADSITNHDGATRPVQGTVLVRTFRYPVIAYGSRLQLEGQLKTPPAGEDFSYKEYLARQDIHSLMILPQITVLAENQGSPFYHGVFAFKQRAQATINHLIPEPQAALLSGILLGNDNGLPPALRNAFQATSTTHIIAISGFNVAILIVILVTLSRSFLSHRGAVLFAIVGITVYTILVGASASVVRAALMGTLYLLSSRWLGRPTYAYASLFLAGFLMTLFRPATLWDIGFQLSFMATLALMLYADPLTEWMRTRLLRVMNEGIVERITGVLTEVVVITITAQALTLPLMAGYFGRVPLVGLLANFLIIPAQPGVMIWGGLAALAGMALPVAGQVFSWVAWLFLSYTILLVRLFAALPGATVPVRVSPASVVAIYAIIAAVTWLAKQESDRRSRLLLQLRQNLSQRLAFGGALLLALLAISWAATQPDGYLHVVFFDVGQGDAIFIQTPSGRQILIDGGLYPTVLHGQLGRQMPFWDREIDILVATHPDADHVTGLVGVFDRYRVGRLITDGEGAGESSNYDALLLAAENNHTPLHSALAGQLITIGDGVRLEILHPGASLDRGNRNENSVSMRLLYGHFAVLLTGDAEEKGERAMLASGRPLHALVFKAGHHGSDSSSAMPFLQAIRPQIIVVSASEDNRYGHPHLAMLQRATEVGAAVLRTDELGTIEVISDGRTMWWQAGP